MIHWLLLINKQGKLRLSKWFDPSTEEERSKVVRDITQLVLTRSSKMCNVVDRHDDKVIYKRYVSLYFVACIDPDDNELLTMELLHLFVEVLDSYFGNVCELDLIFNFTRSYWILNEIFISGELEECSKAAVIAAAQSFDTAAEQVPEFGPTGIYTRSSVAPSGTSSSHQQQQYPQHHHHHHRR